ncbi:gcs-1 [Symbiodinium sp. CCMP2592]|nr:gcs-1 [Symbiodinium sp. CCMP2592]
MKSIKEQIQKAVDEAVKQALASLNLGRGLAAARPSGDPDVQLEPKGRRKRKRKAKQATSHPGGNPDVSGSERAGGRQSAAKGKGKPEDKSGPAKVAQRGGPGDSGQRRGKGKGGCGEAGGQEAGDGWQIVRRKAPEGAFKLRKSDWDAPVVEYAALAEFIDKADASKVLELVVFVSVDQVTLATNILRGSGHHWGAKAVRLSRHWKAFGGNASKAAVDWVAAQRIKVLDTFAWVLEKQRNDTHEQYFGIVRIPKADIEGILAHSGKDGVFVDAARTSGPRAKLQWIEKLPGEKVDAYFERALRQASSLGLVVNGGRLAWRSAMAAGEATVRIWHIDGVPHQEKPLSLWATLAPFRVVSKKQKPLASKAVPVVALEQPVVATIVKPPTGELATGEDGKEVPQQKRVKQEVRTKPGDLQLKACPRDGACVLHAISLGLQWLGDSRPNHPRMLRAQMVEHMRRHVTQYEKEWDGKGPDSEPVKDRDFSAYLTLMEKEGAYCSDVELRALGRVLDIKIVVLPAGLNFSPYAFHSKAAKMLVLWYEDNHVDLMLPPEGHKKYPSEYAQITAGPVFGLRAGGRGPPSVFTASSAACVRSQPSSQWTSVMDGEGAKSQARPASVWTTSMPASASGSAAGRPSIEAQPSLQGRRPRSQVSQARSSGSRKVQALSRPCPLSARCKAKALHGPQTKPRGEPQARSSQATAQARPSGTKRKAVELCTSSVFTCTSTGTIEAFDESEFERARVPPKRCPWLAHATAPADLTFRCNLCPYKRKATSNHQYYHIRHNHYQRAHEGQGLQPDIGRPKLTRVCGPRAQFIWCCPFCNKGITHETRKDLSRFSYYALRNQHRAQAHPEVSKAEWQRLAALPQTGPKDRQVHAKGCRQRNLTKAVFAQVRTPRFGDQMQLFVWPRARCEKRSTRVKHVLLEHGWKCLRCGECTRDLAAAKQHSEGAPCCRGCQACHLHANPLLAVFIKLLSINANRTAISKVDLCADFLQSCGAELLSLQEADINPLSAQGFGERWRAHGYRAVLSDIDAAKGVHRVALVASLPMHRVNLKLPPHVAARCAAGAFEMQAAGSKCITLVVAFYGFPGQPAATAQALGEVRRAAATFGGPYILLGDFNVDQSEQAVVQLLCDGELRSLDEADWTQAGPTNPTRTRRIDFGLAHWSIIATAVKQFERPDLSDHGCVFYETRCLSRADSFSMPKFRELPATATEDILSNFGRVWDAAHFESSIAGEALDEAWAFLSDVAERTLGATSLFDASGARRSDHWLPCARHESHHRVGPQGHESQSSVHLASCLGNCTNCGNSPTVRSCGVRWAAGLGATQVISHLHAELQQQETEARVHRWRRRVEEDPSRALAWVKRKAAHQLAMEQSLQAPAGVPSSVHPASIVEEHGKVWLQHWKPESPVNFDAVQRILDRVPGGPQSDIVLQVEAEALMRATKAMRGKAMGPDRWSAELLLRLPVQWWEAAATLWNAVLSTKYVPRLWRRALIALVPKRLDEYRPIALCPVIWRAGAHCISRNVLPWMDTWLGHHTLGGAPCRGPGDAHARLFHAWQSGGKVFCQQDLTRFFDSLDVKAVGMVLRHLGAPAGLAELLASFYQDASRLFLHEGRSSGAWGSPARGLAQGCPLSPMAAVAVGHIWAMWVQSFAKGLWPSCTCADPLGAMDVALRASDSFDQAFGFQCRASKCAVVCPPDVGTFDQWASARSYPRVTTLKVLGITLDMQEGALGLLKFSPRLLLHRLRFLKLLGGEVPQLRRIVLQLVHSAMFWAGGAACPDRDCLRDVWHSTCAVLQKHATFESPKVLLCASFGWMLDPEWAADWASLRAAWRFKARPPAWLDTAGLDVACGDWRRRFLPGAAAVVQRLGWQVHGNGATLARLDDSGTLRQCHLGWESFDVVKRWLVDHYKWQGVHSCGRIRNRGHRDDATLARGLSLGAPLRSARFALEGHRLAVAAEPTREVRLAALGSGGSIWYHCKRLEMSSPDTTACVCGLAPPSTRAGERLFAAEIPEYPAAPAASDFENTLQSIVAHLRNFATVGERLLIATDGSAKFDVGGCAVIFGSGDGTFVFGDACEDQSAFRCELLTLTTLFEAISRAQLAPGCQVGILVDCSSALQAVAQPEACSMPLLAHKAARLLRDVRAGGLDLKLSWTPAHGRRPNWTAPWGLTADRCRDLNERADAAANSIREHRARGSGRVSWHAELHRAALWERGAILASAGASNVLAQHLRARRPARIIQDDPCAVGAERKRMMDLAAMEAATSRTQLILPVSYRKFRGVAPRNYVLKAMLEGEHASIEDFLERLNEDASAVVGSAVLVDELFRVREALVLLWTEQLTKRCDGDPPWVERLQAMGHFPSTTLWFADGDFGLAPAEAYRDANVQQQRGSREQVAAGLPLSGGRPGAGADAGLVTQPAAGEIEEDAELAGPSEVEATNHGDAALPLQPADKEPPSPASPCLLGNMFSKTGPFGAPSESVDFLGGPLGATAQGGSAIEQSCGTDFLGGPIWTVPQAHAYPSASVDHVQPVQQSLQCLPVCVQFGLPALQRCFAFLQGVRVGEAKHPGRRAPAGEPMLCVCHDWKRGCRLGEASHPGLGFNLDLGNLGDSLGDSIMKSIKEQIQKAVDEAIKQALASLNLGGGLAAARPSGDPDVQLEPKGRRKRKRKAKHATNHPGGNPDVSGGERAGGRQSAAKGKGKPGDKSGPAKVAQRGGPGDSGQRRGKGKGGCGEAGGQEAGDGWQIVRRKAPEGAFKLRKSDWDAPVVEYAALAEFIDKADASKVLELVVFVSADQVTLATNILRGSGLSFKALLVFLSKDEEAQRIPGTIGDRLVFRTAKVQKLTSAGASGHAPQPTGLSQTSIKIKPTESAVVYFKVPKQFASADTWKAFGGNASKAAVDWVAAQRIKVLDTFAWVLEKQRNDTHEQYFGIVRIPKADIEGILAHSGKDGVFVDAARTSGPRAKLQWIEKLPGEKVDAYFERALRQASSLGLVVNGGRLAWRSAMAAGEATVRIWHIDGVPHEWDVDAVGQLLATRFTEYTILSHRRTRLGSCFRFRGQPETADTDLVPFVVEHQEKPLSLWATLAPFRVVSKKQKPLASKAVPVVALEQPVVATIVKPPTGELATGEDGKEVPQQKRVKQEVRTKPGDLQLKACPRDGACVLHALSLGLQWLGDSRPNHPRMLRAQMVEHMRRHATQYEKEWDGKGPDSEPVKDRDFPAYLTLMEKEGAYCSDVELRALGRVLDIKIVVLPAGLNFSPYAFHSKAAKMLVLWYEDNHVDLMLPPEGHKKYPSEYAQITAGPVFGLRAGGRGPPSVFTASSAACVRSQPSSQWTSVMEGEGAKSQARPASVWTSSMPAAQVTGKVFRQPGVVAGKGAGPFPAVPTQCQVQGKGIAWSPDQAQGRQARSSQATAQARPSGTKRKAVELCTSSVFTCTSAGTIEAFDESEFERARVPPKRCPWLAHATAPADLTFRCKRKATSNHQYYHIRHNHYQRAHEGQGLQADIGRPKLTRVCGPRAQFIWCCPFCNKGITHETRKDLSRFSYYALRNQHRAQAHPEVSKAEWQRLAALPQTGPKDRQVHAKGCRQRNLTKAVFAQVRTPRFGDQMQLFVWPRARCEKRSTRVKHVLLEHGWKCLRCGECTRDLAAAKQHSEGAPCCRGCQACHLHANPLLAVFVKLLSINANRTAISKVDLCADFLQSCGAELLSLQEADINPLSAQGFGERWRAHGYRAVLSDIDAAKGVHRVALVASLPMHRVNLKLPPHVAARCAAGAFEMQAAGSKCITLVVAFYGFPGQPAATAQALGEVRRAAATFGGPYILLGDFNVDQSEQAVVQLLCDGELRSLDEADWTQAGPTNPTRTRRIDFGLAHWSIIATAVKQFERPHLSDHGCVFYETRCLSRADSFSMPKFRELPATATEDILSNFGRVWDAAHFESSIAGGALDEAWAFLSDVAERTLGATSLFDASGARRSDHWLPCARHESHHRVGPQGHESQSLRSSRKLLGQLHQLRQQPHCQKLWRAVGRRAGLLRATFPDLPVIHAANLAGATQVISHLHAELQQQETEARVHRWRCRVEEDPSRALAWVKRKADHQLAMEQSPQAHAGVPSSVHPASIVEEHGKVWLQHWKPESPVNFDAVQRILDRVPGGPQSDIVLQVEAEALMRATKAMRGKAMGPDRWSAEFLLRLPVPWWEAAATLWNAVLSTKYVPRLWRRALIALVPKRLDEYRPIALCPVIWRAGAHCISRNVLPWMDTWLGHHTLGGAPCRGPGDAHARLFHAWQSGGKVFCQQDLTRFFDSLDVQAVGMVLRHLGAPAGLAELLASFYQDASRLFLHEGRSSSAWGSPARGLAQGCPLSPMAAVAVGHIWAMWVQSFAKGRTDCLIFIDDRVLWPSCTCADPLGAMDVALRASDSFDQAFGFQCRASKCAVVCPPDVGTFDQWASARSYPRVTTLKVLGITLDMQEGALGLLKFSPRLLLHRLRFLKLLGGEVPQLRRIVLQLVHSAMFWAGGVACPDRDCLRDVWHSTCAVLQKHATFESPKVLLCASFGWSLDPEWAADWASLRAAWRFKARPPAWLDTAGLDVACGDWRRFLPGAGAVVQRLGWQVQGNGAILARLDDSGTLRQCHLGWESFDVVKRWLVDHYKWQGVHSCGRIRNRGHRDDATLARGLSLGAPLRSARFALEGHRLAVAAEPTREVRLAALGSGGSIWYHCKRLEMSSPDTTACVCGLLQPSRAHLTWCCASTTGLRQGLAPPSTRAGERLFAAEITEYPAAPAASDFENILQSIVAHLRNFATVGERLLIATDGSAKFDVGGCAVIFGSGDGTFVFGDACEDQSAFRCELLTLTTLFEAISRAQLAPGCQVGILVDCSSALQAVAQPEACSMPLLAHKAARLLRDVRAGGLDLKLSWTPAHGRRPNWTAPWGQTAARCRDLNERADAAANSIREHRARGSGRVSWHARFIVQHFGSGGPSWLLLVPPMSWRSTFVRGGRPVSFMMIRETRYDTEHLHR